MTQCQLPSTLSPEWPVWFTETVRFLDDPIGDVSLRIVHVGSTSIPGMTDLLVSTYHTP